VAGHPGHPDRSPVHLRPPDDPGHPDPGQQHPHRPGRHRPAPQPGLLADAGRLRLRRGAGRPRHRYHPAGLHRRPDQHAAGGQHRAGRRHRAGRAGRRRPALPQLAAAHPDRSLRGDLPQHAPAGAVDLLLPGRLPRPAPDPGGNGAARPGVPQQPGAGHPGRLHDRDLPAVAGLRAGRAGGRGDRLVHAGAPPAGDRPARPPVAVRPADGHPLRRAGLAGDRPAAVRRQPAPAHPVRATRRGDRDPAHRGRGADHAGVRLAGRRAGALYGGLHRGDRAGGYPGRPLRAARSLPRPGPDLRPDAPACRAAPGAAGDHPAAGQPVPEPG